jgi:predicted HicB family RNase H-like nuclease
MEKSFTTIQVTKSLRARLKAQAAREGVNMQQWIEKCVASAERAGVGL